MSAERGRFNAIRERVDQKSHAYPEHMRADLAWLVDEVERLTPREVTTTEQLDALPVGSVVLFNDGAYPVTPAMRHTDLRWYVTGCNEWIKRSALLPATVLHEPEEGQ